MIRGLGKGYSVAATGKGQCAFESGRTAADNQHGRAAARGSVSLRMPPTAPLLAYRRVLCTSHRHAVMPARNADVATYAFANILLAAFIDLLRQERIGNGGPGAANQVQDPAPDLGDHGIGRCEPPHPDDGFLRSLFDEVDDGLMAAFGREP